MPRTVKYLFIALVILSASCAKRPIIFRDPSFKDYKVLKNQCAFIIWESININSMVQDFITAFDGDPASGEAFIQSYLVDCLTDKEAIYYASGSPVKYTKKRLKFAVLPLDSKADMTLSQDKYEIATLTVTNRESLASVFATTQADHLIVIYGLTVTMGVAAGGGPIVGIQNVPVKGMTLGGGGGGGEFVTMSAQVFVLRTESMSVIWNGFVSGKGNIGRNFTRNTSKEVTRAFVLDLCRALK